MSFIKAAGAIVFVGTSAIFSAWSLILCHVGAYSPATPDRQSDTVPPIVWVRDTAADGGINEVLVSCEDDAGWDEGITNEASANLTLIAGAPKPQCCHGVQLRGTTAIIIQLLVNNPKINDLSYAEVGDEGNRAHSRWMGSTDGCGAQWSYWQDLRVWVRLEYESVGGGPIVRTVTGQWQYNNNGTAADPIGIEDDSGPVNVSMTIDYSQVTVYREVASLTVSNVCRIGTLDLVEAQAPPNGVNPPDLGQAEAWLQMDVTFHRLTDLEATCAVTAGPGGT